MRDRVWWCVVPCLVALCCTVKDRPLEFADAGGSSGMSSAGTNPGDAGEANNLAGESSAGTPATGGSGQSGSGQGGSPRAGSSTGGNAPGGTLGDGGMPPTMSEGGAGELPEGQGTDCTLPPPSCYGALAGPTLVGSPLIDDFEDGNLCAKQHLRGYWFPYGAGQYHMTVAHEGHSGARSLEVFGNEHAGVALRPNGSQFCDEQAFDLSSYTGLEFWVRVVSGHVEVNAAARDAGTEDGGGEFATTLFSPPVVLSGNGWQHLFVAFNTMKDSNSRAFDPATTKILKLQAPTIDPPSFELLIDDVAFY